ncbi:polyprenyl synthetase family protein [Kocuria rhizophila]|uniref:polyprenyl synthetase family protein n=1 Tax=Kocuria rhizophila TaxID=72000 RepID=UPI00057C4AA9|nr:polyprenyl synthetase family protein [Kocuria rhizophila]KIC69069.1 geranylgeranyl pyrophosphate synthase [Kocuria rhizophila]MDA4829830.1 polyprenyl synthetase family protein [Kocuria rhizophila]
MTGSARDLPEAPTGGTPVAAGPRTASGHDAAWPPFRAAVLRELEDFFASPAHRVPCSPGFPLLWERIREQLAGGKLIRPRLTLIAWRSFAQVSGGGAAAQVPDASCVRLAASFEMLHAALLVHDDVVDRDWRRRGRPTVGELFRRDAVAAGASAEEAEHAGESAAILAGDLLLSGALRLATTCTADPRRSRAVADVVFEAVTASAAGELDDLLLSLRRFGAGHPGVQDILDMERLKTATYSFEAPLRAGALLAGAAAEDAERLARAGALLGVGYQVVDDVLGTFGDPEATGKSVDADLRSGKATVLTAHGMQVPQARRVLGQLASGTATVERAREALAASGAREAAVELATDLVGQARELLDGLALPEDERAQLDSLCHHVLNRDS